MLESEENCEDYDYSDCNTEEPFRGYLEIFLTINDENKEVPITVFRGNFEDSVIMVRDTANEDIWEILVGLGEEYSVAAEYKVGDKKVIAIDGTTITKDSYNKCDSTCWEIKDDLIDVELKYDDF